jgi:NagD protein
LSAKPSLNVKKFFNKKLFLFDLDGTLYLGPKRLPGAKELVDELRGMGRSLFFFTNNSSKSKGDYFTKLRGMALAQSRDEIILSTEVLIRYLREKDLRRVFLLGTPAMHRMLKVAGISHDIKNPQAVVVGYDRTLTFEKLRQAARWLSHGKKFIVTHPDLFCPTPEGPEPDCGAFAEALSLTTKRKPDIVLGKPHPRMIQEVLRRVKVKKSDIVLVGDRLSTDIAMANAAGIDSVLVLSGDSKRGDLKTSQFRPSLVVDSVKTLRLL